MADSNEVSIQGRKVLIVDDQAASLYTMSRWFRHAGAEVLSASNGKEAIGLIEREPDLVIIDVNLPDMSGLDLARIFKNSPKTARTPIVQVSAHFGDYSKLNKEIALAADAYLAQPVDPAVMMATVKVQLRARDLESRLAQANLKVLEQVASLEAERDFRDRSIVSLSHDLRSSAGAALMASNVLTEGLVPASESDTYQTMIGMNIKRVMHLIDNILDANSLKAGKGLSIIRKNCDLTEVAKSLVESTSPQLRNRIVLSTDEEVKGRWDCDALYRVIENLTTNAFKYGDPLKPISVKVMNERNSGVITVKNFGAPIPETDQVRIFDLFGRSAVANPTNTRSWGIGLSIVKGITEAHGGTVALTSEAAQGTSFRVELPKDESSVSPE